MTIPVIDVENTSTQLKNIREQHGVKISELQKLFNMTNPQSIYNWENPTMKTLPRIDNLVILAKFYDVMLDDLIAIKEEQTEHLIISEPCVFFPLKPEITEFLGNNCSLKLKDALYSFYYMKL